MNPAMGEAVPPPQPDPATSDASLQTPGVLLKQERQRRGLSVQQSAEGLHLDPWIIEAIESNRFLALGAPVYARGYLRKYAALLGLAPDVIVARYEALTDTPVVPTPVPVITTTPPQRPKWPKYVAWGLVAVIVLGIGVAAYELLMPAPVEAPVPVSQAREQPGAVSPKAQEGTTSPAVAPGTPSQPSPPEPSARAAISAPATKPVAVPTQAQRAAAPAAANSGPRVRLRLEFSEPSWVEVYDADGQRLLYDIGQPERPRNVSGAAPLSVVVGVASAVAVQVNDARVVVPRQANRDSARFQIAADGSVL